METFCSITMKLSLRLKRNQQLPVLSQYEHNESNCVNNVLFKRKTTLILIVWRQQNKGKYLFEEILNDIVKFNPLC